jgi:hypothetical protein
VGSFYQYFQGNTMCQALGGSLPFLQLPDQRAFLKSEFSKDLWSALKTDSKRYVEMVKEFRQFKGMPEQPTLISFFVSPVALRNRNNVPAPFWHPVDVFFVFLSYCLATFCQTL